MAKYTSIIPADGWFFVHRNEEGAKHDYTVHRLAAWGLNEEGKPVGLLPVSAPPTMETNGTNALLVGPPPIRGEYVHEKDMTPAVRDCM